MKKAIMSVLTVWILVSSMFIGLISFTDITNVQAPYIPHLPIRINSDAEFASMAGFEGWTGNGLPGNPYIIEGYDINGSGYGYCIYIGNTTVYFIIKNCFVHEASGVWNFPYYPDSGITLYNIQNSTITNNSASNNHNGIYIDSSNNNTFVNNTAFSNHEDGIRLQYSNITIIVNNTVTNNWRGINLEFSGNNTITNNNASSNNNLGIYLYSSSNNTIALNNASSHIDDGIHLVYSSNNTITYNNVSKNNYGIILDSSIENDIENNYITDNTLDGILFLQCNSNNITRNDIFNNYVGVTLYSSVDNIISVNNISENGNGIQLNWYSDNNYIYNNQIHSNKDEYGIKFESSNENNVSNNNISNNWYGIYYWGSKLNFAFRNTLTLNWYAFFLRDAVGITITNNSMKLNGIYLQGDQLKYWNTHFIDISNEVNEKPLYYLKNQTEDNIPIGGGQVILANCSNISVSDQNLSFGTVGIQLGFSSYNNLTNNYAIWNSIGGIYLHYSIKNTITNNNASNNNYAGLRLRDSDQNIIINNNLSDNWRGIFLFKSDWNRIFQNNLSSNSDYGIYLGTSKYNVVFHNNFLANFNQAFTDSSQNNWDDDYPLGGNYWSDYTGNDSFKGPNQDIPGSDGIGDTPYPIDNNIIAEPQDNYPLMKPYLNIILENYIILKQGWNLISIPLIQQNQNLKKVLEMIDGWYDAVQWHDNSDLNDPWKHHQISKPPHLNDLTNISHTISFWIHITHPGDTIFLYNGTQPTSNQSILLHPGWNMVGYPSLTNRNRTAALNNLTFGVEVDAVWTFNAATQTWEEIKVGDYFEVGRGYWIHATKVCVWEVGV